MNCTLIVQWCSICKCITLEKGESLIVGSCELETTGCTMLVDPLVLRIQVDVVLSWDRAKKDLGEDLSRHSQLWR